MKKYLSFSLLLLLFSCKQNQDPCQDISCRNGGTCQEGICQCPAGFEGARCEVLSNGKFLGNYQTHYTCNSALHTLAIASVPDNDTYIALHNLGDYSCSQSFDVQARIKGDSLFLLEQAYCTQDLASGYLFKGKGKLIQDSLVLDFEVQYANQTDICRATLIRE